MVRTKNVLTIDLSEVISTIRDAIMDAVIDATSHAVTVATKPEKAPRKAKVAREEKPAAVDAPKRARAAKGDFEGIAQSVASMLRHAGCPLKASEVIAAFEGADAKEVKRALLAVPGLVVTGKAKGTRYGLAPFTPTVPALPNAGDMPPMGSHANGETFSDA